MLVRDCLPSISSSWRWTYVMLDIIQGEIGHSACEEEEKKKPYSDAWLLSKIGNQKRSQWTPSPYWSDVGLTWQSADNLTNNLCTYYQSRCRPKNQTACSTFWSSLFLHFWTSTDASATLRTNWFGDRETGKYKDECGLHDKATSALFLHYARLLIYINACLAILE